MSWRPSARTPKKFSTSCRTQRSGVTTTSSSTTPPSCPWKLTSSLKDAGKTTGCKSKQRLEKEARPATSLPNVNTSTIRSYSTASTTPYYNSSPMQRMASPSRGAGRTDD
jgi:hypothetical protein